MMETTTSQYETIPLEFTPEDQAKYVEAFVMSHLSPPSHEAYRAVLVESGDLKEALLHAALNEFVNYALRVAMTEHNHGEQPNE